LKHGGTRAAGIMDTATSIVLIVLTLLLALVIGLLLRRILVRRLKNTVLDNWLVQILGILVIIPLLLLTLTITSILFINIGGFKPITDLWMTVKNQIQLHDVTNLAWSVIESILIIALGVGIARTLKKATINSLGEQRIDINIRTLLGRTLYFIVLSFAIFWMLSLWSVSLTVPVAAIGALTVAFTFAIQDILKDLVAGLYILVERPFHIGDQVTTSNYTGVVEDVQLRATKLHLLSGEEVTIPNSLIFGGTVVNNTFYDKRRATIPVTLAPEDFSQEQTPEQILNTISALDVVMAKPEPALTVSSFTGTVGGYTGLISGYTGKTVTLTVRFWIASRQFSAVTEVMYALRQALPHADFAVRESAGDI